MGEQHADGPAVQIVDVAEINAELQIRRVRSRLGQGFREGFDVAQVHLACRLEHQRAVVSAVGGQAQRCDHHAILACMWTVVPPASGSIVTSCIRPRISAMPRPRCAAATGVFQEPVSTTETCSRSARAVARNVTVPPVPQCPVPSVPSVLFLAWRWPCSMAFASASPVAISTSRACSALTPARVEPAAQRGPAGSELTDIGGHLHLQGRRLTVEEHRHVVLISLRGRQPGHDQLGQLVQCADTVGFHHIGRAGDAVVERFAATLHQTVGVEQQGGPRRHGLARFGADLVVDHPKGCGLSTVEQHTGTVRAGPGSAADGLRWSTRPRRCPGSAPHRTRWYIARRSAAPRNRSTADSAAAGLGCSSSSARAALRSWPMTVAAARPWPTQSPTIKPIRPLSRSTTSYQSPPTCSGLLAG